MKSYHLIFFVVLFLTAEILAANINIKTVHAKKGESTIEYTLIHPLHTVHGISKDVDCVVNYDNSNEKITGVSVRADVLSFDSGNSNRDSHMAEVMDALDYPDVSFHSDSVQELKDDTLEVFGKLTFHNVSKMIPVKVSETFENGETVFKGSFNVSLTEFKIERPKLLLMPVEDKLAVQFNIVVPQLLKKT